MNFQVANPSQIKRQPEATRHKVHPAEFEDESIAREGSRRSDFSGLAVTLPGLPSLAQAPEGGGIGLQARESGQTKAGRQSHRLAWVEMRVLSSEGRQNLVDGPAAPMRRSCPQTCPQRMSAPPDDI
jgi:hypothetical protein